MSDETGRTPSDEELAKIARDVQRDYLRAHDGGAWHPDNDDEMWEQIARALRAALTPAVAPLAPGETVTIPDCLTSADLLSAEWSVHGRRLYLLPVLDGDTDDSDRGMIALDAAGIATLETVCRRARAALEGATT